MKTKTTITLKLLNAFCGDAPDRPYLDEPFRYTIDDRPWVIATDGRIAIRVDASLFPQVETRNQDREGIGTTWRLYRDRDWKPLRSKTSMQKCGLCGGTKLCRHCNEGPCPDCLGTGKRPTGVVTFGKQSLAARYVWLASMLPDVKFCEGDTPENPVSFKFTGGQGLLMPLRKSDYA